MAKDVRDHLNPLGLPKVLSIARGSFAVRYGNVDAFNFEVASLSAISKNTVGEAFAGLLSRTADFLRAEAQSSNSLA